MVKLNLFGTKIVAAMVVDPRKISFEVPMERCHTIAGLAKLADLL